MRVGRIEVCYDFVLYSFRNFEPVEFFENKSDVVVFWGFSNSTGENILNSLEAVYLGDVYVEEERIAVVYSVLDQTIRGFILDRLLPDRFIHGAKAAQAIHSFIRCRHSYSASLSGTTQNRFQPQHGQIIIIIILIIIIIILIILIVL